MPPIDLRCPRCGQMDKVISVPALYTQGRTTGTETRVYYENDYRMERDVHFHTQNDLSVLLTPPPNPDIKSDSGVLLRVVILLAMGAGGIIGGLAVNNSTVRIALLVLGGLCLLATLPLFAALSSGGKMHRQGRDANWQRAMMRWNGLCYCERDFIVFEPGRGDYAPVKQMKKYLYR